MIPRYQRVLFWSLVAGISFMAGVLLRGCHQANSRRLAALNDSTPIAAPTDSGTEEVILYLANDADGSITPTRAQLALPKEPSLRARTLLNHLLAQYVQSDSQHEFQSAPAVDDVFLTSTMPDRAGPKAAATTQTAIINLHGSFVSNHPSGIEVEGLTLLSIIGTLHDAFPKIDQVRFLVDGQPHDTLAGHADLTRAYPAIDTSIKATDNLQPGSPANSLAGMERATSN
jgi:hypothetical protein